MPTVPTFAVRETDVSRTANVGTVGMNGLITVLTVPALSQLTTSRPPYPLKIFHLVEYPKNIPLRRIKRGTLYIDQINCTKFMNLNIYSNLHSKNHIDYVLCKISKSVGIYIVQAQLLLYNFLLLPYLTH